MVWTAANISLLSLDAADGGELVQDNEITSFTEFVAIGRGFPLDHSAFVFVHAHDTTDNLKAFHVIPTEDVQILEVVSGGNIQQEIRFKASLHERRSGDYHLVGFSPAVEEGTGHLVNQTATLEHAFTLHPAPAGKLALALDGTSLSQEPD